MKIVISSGKGGTGKTFIATNLAITLAKINKIVNYIDCDVEEPNGHLFLKPQNVQSEDISIVSPIGIDNEICRKCGKCAEACNYNAIAIVKEKALFFNEMCHACGACKIVCPFDAIIEDKRKIGVLKKGTRDGIGIYYGALETAEGGMSPRLIQKVKEYATAPINILDSPPGTACPVVETVKDADLCVLVTDPTPFGIHDLKLAVNMCRDVGQEPVVVVNRAEYYNDDLQKYCDEAEINIIGEIPDDRHIAEVYSVGDLVVTKIVKYALLFEILASSITQEAEKCRTVKKTTKKQIKTASSLMQEQKTSDLQVSKSKKELVVISGKGGTGKTSLSACFAALASNHVICDCDVDAADLHLVLAPKVKEQGFFSGGSIASIEQNKCVACGACMLACQFAAIKKTQNKNNSEYHIDPISCEGCGVCSLVCQNDAVNLQEAINGEWYISDTKYGPMSHAELGVAEENSGKLVSLVRRNASLIADQTDNNFIIMDGAPGTGCPVIASITGASYALVVTEPTVSGLHDMIRIINVIKHFRVQAGVVVNKYDLNLDMTYKIKMECQKHKLDYLGTIPYDKSITEAQVQGLPAVMFQESAATKSIKHIWENIRKDKL